MRRVLGMAYILAAAGMIYLLIMALMVAALFLDVIGAWPTEWTF